MAKHRAGTIRFPEEKATLIEAYAAEHGISTFGAAVNILVTKGLQAEAARQLGLLDDAMRPARPRPRNAASRFRSEPAS